MSDRPELPDKSDIPIAYRAICLASISGNAKQIAAIILGHFNVKTGQCDPGTETLMRRANVSRRTVVSATEELNRIGMVVKIRHGGNGFRSRYQPNWRLFREIVDGFERGENPPEKVQKVAHSRCRKLHLDSAGFCTLTQSRNSSQKLNGTDGASGGVQVSKLENTSSAVSAERVQGLVRRSLRRSSQFQRGPLSVVDAEEAARRQLDEAIEALGETMRTIVLGRITPEIEQAALVAEQKSRGAGLRLVVDRVSSITGGR